VAAIAARADKHAASVLPIIREVQKAGARALREIADALNARGVPTARRGPLVRNVCQQCADASVAPRRVMESFIILPWRRFTQIAECVF
jgi:hypothetical protein